jgi:hypothetical protein
MGRRSLMPRRWRVWPRTAAPVTTRPIGDDEASAVYRRWLPGEQPDEFTEARVAVPAGGDVPVDVAEDERVWLYAPGPDSLYLTRPGAPTSDWLHLRLPPQRVYGSVRVTHPSGLAGSVIVLRAPADDDD